jgi:hypothetical protein
MINMDYFNYKYLNYEKSNWINLFFKYNIEFITLQFSRKRQIQLIKQKLSNIKFIIFPTKEMQLNVVKKYLDYVNLINFQHKKVKEFVINSDPNLIERINKPTYDMKMKAVQYNPINIIYVGKLDYDLCAEAIRQRPQLFNTLNKNEDKNYFKRKLSRKDYKKIKELYEFLII